MRGIAQPGYHFCASPKCPTQISDGGPILCPVHGPHACQQCGGRGQYISQWNEALDPPIRYNTCVACGGTGQRKPTTPGMAWAMYAVDRISDLDHLILEAKSKLLYDAPEGSLQAQFNRRLRRIISSIQDLRNEIGSWKS